ncbi:hypothetical protein [Erythrobacter sp.]|uniref:hypothetical protein n=1 Tax=Erythrobacter sp. TaxID=1042 RepID=UPI0025FAD0D7|nr:hypothetical protein [Erythrobacter sp.]
MDFRVVFDLISNPEKIEPAYSFYALFFMIGIALLIAAILLRHRFTYWHAMSAFSVFFMGFSALMTSKEIEKTSRLRSLVESGQFTTIEGCLDYFKPGSRNSSRNMPTDERWSVNGTEFTYGAGEVRSGYHLVEPRGGAVHSNSKVRVSFVETERHNRREIVRLAVAEGTCPEAPTTDQ